MVGPLPSPAAESLARVVARGVFGGEADLADVRAAVGARTRIGAWRCTGIPIEANLLSVRVRGMFSVLTSFVFALASALWALMTFRWRRRRSVVVTSRRSLAEFPLELRLFTGACAWGVDAASGRLGVARELGLGVCAPRN